MDKGRNAFAAVSNELQDVTRIMVSNIEDVIHRGEALNSLLFYFCLIKEKFFSFKVLESRASDLSHLSKKYREDARQLNRRTAVFKLFIAIGVASILFLIFRFVYF